MSCDICNILENKDIFHFVYEDDICFVILHESPSYPGHCLVIPKEHVPIFEELDDKTAEHLFLVSNKVSTAIFESIGAHGTNIILNNGHDAGQELPHLVINVIPRKEKDGMNFEWPPKKISNDALKAMHGKIKLFSDAIFSGKDKLPTAKVKHDDYIEHNLVAGQQGIDRSKPGSSVKHVDSGQGTATKSHGDDGHKITSHKHEEKGEDYLTKNLIRQV